MTAFVRISARSARLIVGMMADRSGSLHPYETRAFEELKAALRPRPSKRLSRERKTAKKATKKDARAELRAKLVERSDGNCEHCGHAFWEFRRDEMDHFFSRREPENERTCWLICSACHLMKTKNQPDAEHWLRSFVRHARLYGFSLEATRAQNRLDSIALMSQAVTT